MKAYYNEFKPEAAHMLRQLIKDGVIAPGDVDERSITEVKSDDLKGYTQCHFFAGIGGWSVALRLAGIPDDRPLWTGSPPCQEHSTAGKQKGASGSRNLWPHFGRLIAESKPPTVFGEQVASAIAYGWLDEAANDMEAQGYAFAAAVLPACSVGSPHKRERIWFVADSCLRDDGRASRRYESQGPEKWIQERNENGELGESGGTMGDTQSVLSNERKCREHPIPGRANKGKAGANGGASYVADPKCLGRQGQGQMGQPLRTEESGEREAGESFDDSTGLCWISCPDGKSRPVKSGIRLLAHGIQHRAPILHALGNAIVPQVAAEFIKACLEIS